jgi:hypothetical protein
LPNDMTRSSMCLSTPLPSRLSYASYPIIMVATLDHILSFPWRQLSLDSDSRQTLSDRPELAASLLLVSHVGLQLRVRVCFECEDIDLLVYE